MYKSTAFRLWIVERAPLVICFHFIKHIAGKNVTLSWIKFICYFSNTPYTKNPAQLLLYWVLKKYTFQLYLYCRSKCGRLAVIDFAFLFICFNALVINHARPIQSICEIINVAVRINMAFHISSNVFHLCLHGFHVQRQLHWQ